MVAVRVIRCAGRLPALAYENHPVHGVVGVFGDVAVAVCAVDEVSVIVVAEVFRDRPVAVDFAFRERQEVAEVVVGVILYFRLSRCILWLFLSKISNSTDPTVPRLNFRERLIALS